MTSEKAMWGWPQYVDDQATLEGGMFQGDYAVTNLKDVVELANVARTLTADDGAFEVKCAFNRQRAVRISWLLRHNFGITAKWQRLYYRNVDYTDLVYDTGKTLVWPVLDLDTEWEDDNHWTRTYTEAQRKGTQTLALDVLPQRVFCQSVITRVFDSTNPDSYLQASVIGHDRDIQNSVNFGFGARYGFEPRTLSQEAEGGAEYFERRTKRRIFNGEIRFLPRQEVLENMYELQRLADIDRPFVFISNPSASSTWLREAAFVRHVSLDPMVRAAAGRDSVPFNYKEAI